MAHSVTIVLVTALCCCLAPCFGYSISPCDDNNKVQFEESDDAVLTCTGITHDDMVWRLTGSGVSQIGTCSWPNGMCSVTDSDYTLSRPDKARSVLNVTDNPRTKIAGTVQCAGLSPEGNLEGIVSCDVRVVYTSYQPTSCTVTVITSSPYWTVSGSCDVNKIYASDEVYSCRWFETPQFGSGSRSFPGNMNVMSSFNEGGRSYYTARCHHSDQPMPTNNSNYIYSVKIDPPNTAYTTAHTLQIQSPAGPPVLLSCPDSMIEGDNDTCPCQASAAEPSALVTWSGSASSAVSDTATLLLNDVAKSLDGHNYTCSQYWGGTKPKHEMTTLYTLHVKYPPSSPPQISGNTTGMVGDSLVLHCTVTGGNPPVDYVTFYCGDNHGDNVDSTSTENGQTVVTSTIEIDSLTDRNNGSQCMCSTNWEPRPTLYQTTSTVTILVLGLPGQSTPSPSEPATTVSGATSTTGKPSTSSEDDGDAALVGGVVGGIAAIIIIALIIVIICLWKRIREPRYARPATGRQDDDHNYTELDHYQQIGPQEQRTERKEEGTMDQDRDENSDVNPLESSSKAQYENTGFSEEPALSDGHYENTPEGRRPTPSEEDYEIPRRAVRQP